MQLACAPSFLHYLNGRVAASLECVMLPHPHLAHPLRFLLRAGGRHPNGTATPESREFSFRMPAGPPAELKIGVIGDPGGLPLA